ncbi:MAG: hypothetical protein L0H36_00465 [bacterium]|nr:hypothetical protein [bacterium]
MEQYTAEWREIVNNYPDEIENYSTSVNDMRDVLIECFLELTDDVDEIDPDELLTISQAIEGVVDSLDAIYASEQLHVAGNGLYYSENTDEISFLDSTAGIQGEFAGFTIDSAIPKYSQLVYDDEYVYKPVLCMKLENYRTFADNGTQSEAHDDTAIVPVMNQDICVNRSLY